MHSAARIWFEVRTAAGHPIFTSSVLTNIQFEITGYSKHILEEINDKLLFDTGLIGFEQEGRIALKAMVICTTYPNHGVHIQHSERAG
jgi:hypothetical protein